MRGTWDDVSRRLAGGILSLDVHDALVVGDQQDPPPRSLGDRLLGRTPERPPRRFVQITAAQRVLIAECVGSASFGGDWAMSPETEQTLERQGWERPRSPGFTTYQREAALASAPQLARAAIRALRALGCEVEDLEVSRTREEPDGGANHDTGYY